MCQATLFFTKKSRDRFICGRNKSFALSNKATPNNTLNECKRANKRACVCVNMHTHIKRGWMGRAKKKNASSLQLRIIIVTITITKSDKNVSHILFICMRDLVNWNKNWSTWSNKMHTSNTQRILSMRARWTAIICDWLSACVLFCYPHFDQKSFVNFFLSSCEVAIVSLFDFLSHSHSHSHLLSSFCFFLFFAFNIITYGIILEWIYAVYSFLILWKLYVSAFDACKWATEQTN